MSRESWPHANEMLIIWQSRFSGNAVTLRHSGNKFYADHGFHPHQFPHFRSCYAAILGICLCFRARARARAQSYDGARAQLQEPIRERARAPFHCF